MKSTFSCVIFRTKNFRAYGVATIFYLQYEVAFVVRTYFFADLSDRFFISCTKKKALQKKSKEIIKKRQPQAAVCPCCLHISVHLIQCVAEKFLYSFALIFHFIDNSIKIDDFGQSVVVSVCTTRIPTK